MKAPLSNRILEILSDQVGSKMLVETIINNPHSDNQSIKIGNKKYELQRVTGYQKH